MKNDTASEPEIRRVYDYLIYGLSLPERTLRSTAAMVGGVLNESAELLVPQAFRDSRSYQTFVQQMVDMLATDVGGVSKQASSEEGGEQTEVENFVARKTVGSFLDLAGMATLHVSPVVILAIVSDMAYGSKTYLDELAENLKEEGVIAADSTIHNAADLLESISVTSGETAAAFDTPPISIEGLRKTIQDTSDNLARIDPTTVLPRSEIDQLWNEMKGLADREKVGLLEMSSAVTMYTLNQVNTVRKGALTTIMVTGDLVDRHVLDHYWQGMEQISERGLYTVVAEAGKPYFEAVWFNYSMQRETVTADLVTGKLVGKLWQGVRGWITATPPEDGHEKP